MKKSARIGIFIFAAFVVLILIGMAMPNFMRVKNHGYDANYIQTNADFDSQYRDQTRSSSGMAMGGAEMAPMAEMKSGMGSDYAATADLSQSMDDSPFYMIPDEGTNPLDPSGPGDAQGPGGNTFGNWLNPAAWAAEDNIDERYIVRSGSIESEIKDYDEAAAEVVKIAGRHKGLVTDSQMEKYGDDMRVGSITLRIPSENFQQAYDDLRAIGEVRVQSVSSEDVSTEYIAAGSRLESLQMEHETLQGMLADAREVQRSRGLGEAYSVLLDTQARLSQVTSEMQNVENRVKALRDQITRSTIRISLSERIIAPPIDEADWSIGATFERAKRDLQQGVDATLGGIVYFLVNGLIWWIIWLGIIFLVWKLILRRLWLKLWLAMQDGSAAERAESAKGKPQS